MNATIDRASISCPLFAEKIDKAQCQEACSVIRTVDGWTTPRMVRVYAKRSLGLGKDQARELFNGTGPIWVHIGTKWLTEITPLEAAIAIRKAVELWG